MKVPIFRPSFFQRLKTGFQLISWISGMFILLTREFSVENVMRVRSLVLTLLTHTAVFLPPLCVLALDMHTRTFFYVDRGFLRFF